MNLIAEIIGSYWLALIFQTSHVISEVGLLYVCSRSFLHLLYLSRLQVEWPKPDKDNVVHMDW